ncbi:3 alpha-hydroxysteroid dehydrogenase/carbonyl reductase [Shewanella halifaxensis HAW-EB4]|uniref:3 alpha-hydroxysteroid dehydrogenase/carbonyl reductase n=1 Tax=Shewanella halifaxensis (strain HAW-EB4) TaxID=458817 RepID=B0TTS7_SHEHH|nr:SDR family oxidoreductase [Shewanella halifaxensis]ABZ76645.1 3 alpha-hydroxysteroid dehydrogenase/carbonyl reductase [Shewanella halifaxensis HAW-EB4]
MPTTAVTGSASGIGAAVCAQLEKAGHTIIGIDRKTDDNFTSIAADLSTAEGRQNAIDLVYQQSNGVLDGLVCCAGLGVTAPNCGLIVEVNYFGVTSLVTGLYDALRQGEQASVVVIGSVAANQQVAAPHPMALAMLDSDEALATKLANEDQQAHIAYAASKFAVTSWSRQTAVKWGGNGIRVNVVAPGAVETPLHQASKDDARYGEAVRNFVAPIGRNSEAEEIASVVTFLQSNQASFIHGSVLFVDGGMDAMMRANSF